MTGEYRLTRRVHFYETDAAGIVHFSWFPRYMEEAEHALWRAAGLSISRPGSEIGWPRVAISFEFYRPLRFEEEFEIWIRIAAIEEKRIHYSCTLIRGDTEVASGKMTIACVSRLADGTMKSTPIPREIAQAFEVADRPKLP
jgi:acyl-CoA thioester hydrolase